MKLTWYGHSAFRIEVGAAKILIDPFLSSNPSWGNGWEEPAEGITHVLLTHGHNDHLGDALAILKKTDAMLVANFEICNYLAGQGVNGDKVNPGTSRRHRGLRWFHYQFRQCLAFLVIRYGRRTECLSRQSERPRSHFPMTKRSITWATPTSLVTWR